jgi:hypothetical protein
MNRDSFAGWEAALGAIPDLGGAACRDQSELFDETTDPGMIAEAKLICTTQCGAYDRCASWAATLSDNDVAGVVAGRVRTWVGHPSLRKKRSA